MKKKKKNKIKREREEKNQKELSDFQSNIRTYSNLTYRPVMNNPVENDTDSWFAHRSYPQVQNNNNNDMLIPKYEKIEHDGYYIRTFELFPTKRQQRILDHFMKAYILMYNETIRYFKGCRFNREPAIMLIGPLKEQLRLHKEHIIENCVLKLVVMKGNKKKIIKIHPPSHLLDYAINDSVSAYKSCLTNLQNGHIKHFRLRYLKHSKKNQIFKVEKYAFTKNAFYARYLGRIKMKNDDMQFNDLVTMSTVRKVCKSNKYYLQLKYKRRYELHSNTWNSTKIGSFDPGIRTGFTCYGNDSVEEIGTNCYEEISKILRKIDRINASDMSKAKKAKSTNKRWTKLKNMVDDFHWKSIKFIVSKYSGVIIGNLSTKQIDQGNVNDMVKRVGDMLSLHKFRSRLKYKCYYAMVDYLLISERNTTQCCSDCGYQKKDVGSNKTFNCNACGMVLDRDVNSGRNMFLKSL